MRDDFAVLVISHGRADRVVTWAALAKHGYTGRRYVVIDDEDKQGELYRKRYGKAVLTFSKSEEDRRTDCGDNFHDFRSPLWARNACFALARGLGLRYFMVMDDDYNTFSIRFNEKRQWGSWLIRRLDDAIEAMIDYFAAIPALSIAMSQAGEHLGGGAANNNIPKRKAMNTFLCDVERPFRFVARLNDDVTTYVVLSFRGALFLTVPAIMVSQKQTQTEAGGLTEAYLDAGTYVKSFYTVMYCPSAVKVSTMHSRHARIHHRITWPHCAAQIIDEKWRKPEFAVASQST